MRMHTPSPAADGRLAQELRWVHDLLRRDLATVRRLAAQAAGGLPAPEIRAALARLEANGPLWQLKVNCLRYCSVVHHHHQLESALLFPALRRANPDLGPVVDKLEADHAAVSDLLDAVGEAAETLVGEDTPGVREKLVAALDTLADELLAHLAYEEEHISPTLNTFTEWPFF
jgi:hypothetical protein